MWYPNPSHDQKLEGYALPHQPFHGGTSSTLPVAGSTGSQEGAQGAKCKKSLCTHVISWISDAGCGPGE